MHNYIPSTGVEHRGMWVEKREGILNPHGICFWPLLTYITKGKNTFLKFCLNDLDYGTASVMRPRAFVTERTHRQKVPPSSKKIGKQDDHCASARLEHSQS